VNTELEESPENVNDEPYGSGWMIVIEYSDESELAGLLSAEQYQESIEE
jgi:glycine cleavage system H protein